MYCPVGNDTYCPRSSSDSHCWPGIELLHWINVYGAELEKSGIIKIEFDREAFIFTAETNGQMTVKEALENSIRLIQAKVKLMGELLK